jgi:hypothetical protein
MTVRAVDLSAVDVRSVGSKGKAQSNRCIAIMLQESKYKQ